MLAGPSLQSRSKIGTTMDKNESPPTWLCCRMGGFVFPYLRRAAAGLLAPSWRLAAS